MHRPTVTIRGLGAADEGARPHVIAQHAVQLGTEKHDSGNEEEPAEQRNDDGERSVGIAGAGDVAVNDQRSEELQDEDRGGGDEGAGK